jgi:hypothetical protein
MNQSIETRQLDLSMFLFAGLFSVPYLSAPIFSNLLCHCFGNQQLFDTQRNNVHEILFQVHLKASQLDAEFEMSGKSVEDSAK